LQNTFRITRFGSDSFSKLTTTKTLVACFNKPTFPAVNVRAASRDTCQKGKFHGIIASTLSIGLWRTKLFEASELITSSAKKASDFPHNNQILKHIFEISGLDSFIGFPISNVINVAYSSLLSRSN
jgi:hypothetical protein